MYVVQVMCRIFEPKSGEKAGRAVGYSFRWCNNPTHLLFDSASISPLSVSRTKGSVQKNIQP